MTASEIATAWAAGLFEGEGSFALRWKGPGNRAMLEMQISMTDLDVLETFQAAAECGSVKAKAMRKTKTHWKDQWVWRVSGRKALDLALRLRPHLGNRRRDRLDAIIEIIESTQLQIRPCECCETSFTPTRFARERFCSTRCRDNAKYLNRKYGTTSIKVAYSRGYSGSA